MWTRSVKRDIYKSWTPSQAERFNVGIHSQCVKWLLKWRHHRALLKPPQLVSSLTTESPWRIQKPSLSRPIGPDCSGSYLIRRRCCQRGWYQLDAAAQLGRSEPEPPGEEQIHNLGHMIWTEYKSKSQRVRSSVQSGPCGGVSSFSAAS